MGLKFVGFLGTKLRPIITLFPRLESIVGMHKTSLDLVRECSSKRQTVIHRVEQIWKKTKKMDGKCWQSIKTIILHFLRCNSLGLLFKMRIQTRRLDSFKVVMIIVNKKWSPMLMYFLAGWLDLFCICLYVRFFYFNYFFRNRVSLTQNDYEYNTTILFMR